MLLKDACYQFETTLPFISSILFAKIAEIINRAIGPQIIF
jgi:hypothetical protein